MCVDVYTDINEHFYVSPVLSFELQFKIAFSLDVFIHFFLANLQYILRITRVIQDQRWIITSFFGTEYQNV